MILIEENCIIHANVGDGEGFLRWKDGRIQPVTHAHKVGDPAELARIREFEEHHPGRKCLVDLRAGGWAVADPLGNFIRVARSIGDPKYDPEVLTRMCRGMLGVCSMCGKLTLLFAADPFVGVIPLTKEADFVVIASDGLWDVMTFEEVADFIVKQDNHSHLKIAEMLVDEAIARNSQDNVTAVVAFLNLSSPLPHTAREGSMGNMSGFAAANAAAAAAAAAATAAAGSTEKFVH